MIRTHGDLVRISLLSAALPSGGGANTTAVALYTPARVASSAARLRVLQSYEQLIIDNLLLSSYGVAGSQPDPTSSPNAEEYALCDVAGNTGFASAVQQYLILASFVITSNNGESVLDLAQKEGLVCAPGITPSLIGMSGNGYSLKLTGTGRIITAGTQGTRPNWRESLNGAQPA